MKKQTQPKTPSKLLAWFYKYWITMLLLVVLLTLIRQNFIINQFPMSLSNKQKIIKQASKRNQTLAVQNKIQAIKLQAQTASDDEMLESQARYRFGLIKQGESYYRIINEQ